MKKIYQKIWEVRERVGKIEKGKENPYFKSKYFDINLLLDVLAPELTKAGLTVAQPLINIGGKAALSTVVTGEGEDILEFTVVLPENSDPQKMGSIITYFRRYALQSLFCLQAEDDDGNVASGGAKKEANPRPIGGASPQDPREDY